MILYASICINNEGEVANCNAFTNEQDAIAHMEQEYNITLETLNGCKPKEVSVISSKPYHKERAFDKTAKITWNGNSLFHSYTWYVRPIQATIKLTL